MKQQSRDNLRKEFGNHLRKWRRKLDLTQNAVASGAGIHVNFLSELERGVKSPTLETI